MSYTDDAGKNWTPATGCGVDTLLDHQTRRRWPVPRADPGAPDVDLPRRRLLLRAERLQRHVCGEPRRRPHLRPGSVHLQHADQRRRRPDPQIAAEGGACSGLHGHIKVGADGTAYVPLKGCGGTPTANNLTNSEYFGGGPAVSVSKDNGTTWTVHRVPGAHNQDESDNSVDLDKANRLYMAWEDGTNPSTTHVRHAQRREGRLLQRRGHALEQAGRPVHRSSACTTCSSREIVAGDKGRAAVSFIGTNAIGDDQHNGFVGPGQQPGRVAPLHLDDLRRRQALDDDRHHAERPGPARLRPDAGHVQQDRHRQQPLQPAQPARLQRHHGGQVTAACSPPTTDGCTGTCVHGRAVKGKGAVDMLTRLSAGKGLVAKYDGKLGQGAGRVARLHDLGPAVPSVGGDGGQPARPRSGRRSR